MYGKGSRYDTVSDKVLRDGYVDGARCSTSREVRARVLVKLTTATVILDLQIAENYSSECQTWIIGALLPTSQQYWLCDAVVKSSDCRRLCILHNEQYLAIPCQFKMLLRGQAPTLHALLVTVNGYAMIFFFHKQ